MELMICVRKERYAICKLSSLPDLFKIAGFCSVSHTDKEISLVCKVEEVPETAYEVSKEWIMFEMRGKLDFDIVGLIAEISTALAKRDVPLFALSTFNTDYFLVKREYMEKAIDALITTGYPVVQ
ncbi:MAG: ACT domain-containing protein [Christensenellaceae bacterium]|nr:ACT domain-containing protein [Christensenellaceae bacterium]